MAFYDIISNYIERKIRDYFMLKKHGKELVMWIVIPVLIVLALLFMVYVFEIKNIHVPGKREMWIGLIGAVLGGMFTMIGVLVTIYKQEEQNEEIKRLEYMPILIFNIMEPDRIIAESDDKLKDEPLFDAVLARLEGELCTSSFQFVEEKLCKALKISVLNNACVFDFVMEGCLIDGREIHKGDAFNPAMRRLVSDEKYVMIFNDGDYSNQNEFCLIRFSYKDIFGNKYYQDLPIEYDEIKNNGLLEQAIEIKDIKAPVFENDKVKSLEEAAKEYNDYKELC